MSHFEKTRQYRAISLRRLWRFVAHHVGHRGAVMAFLTMLDILYGYSLNTEPGALVSVNLAIPLHIWSIIWISVGVILMTGISARRDKFHYGMAVALKAAWATVFLRAWLFEGYARGWVVAVIWGGFAALMFVISSWPEGFVHKEPLEKKEDGEK